MIDTSPHLRPLRQVRSLPASGPLDFYSQPCTSHPADPTDPPYDYKLSLPPLDMCDVVFVETRSKQTTPYSYCNALTNGNTHLQTPACWVYASTKPLEAATREGWIMVSQADAYLDGFCTPDPKSQPSEPMWLGIPDDSSCPTLGKAIQPCNIL